MTRVRWSHPVPRERSRYGAKSFFTSTGEGPMIPKAVVENGIYRILGRSSVDIIKTGGEKVSALEIEETLLTHPDIRECAVVGVPDPVWGEKVCAALLLEAGKAMDIDTLRAWGKERLAPYKVPKDVAVIENLPRNAMGKIIKPDVKKIFQG
jgi:malonyl-CoA/methylmalonyl-CoA synthetase